MRVAAFKRRNGKLFGEFISIGEASRLLNIPGQDIARSITGQARTAWAMSGPQRKLGAFVFREIDGTKVGRG